MNFYYNLFYQGIKKVIDVMQDFDVFTGVSLFSFLIALTVMTIVITYLVNVARSPGVRSVSSEQASKRAQESHNARMKNYEASTVHHETASNYYASKTFHGK